MLAALRRAAGLVPAQPTHGRDVPDEIVIGHAATSTALAVASSLAGRHSPGICWHQGHVELDGERFGVTPHTGRLTAALTVCINTGPGGR